MSTHLHWSIEQNNRCPICKDETLLIVAFSEMKIAEGDEDTFQNRLYEEHGGSIEISEEISGHYCPACDKLVSLALNT